jgi:predicted nucleotide-binding protein
MKIRLLTESAYNRIITLKETMSKKDRGYGVHESNIPPKNRARQNVVFEHGYLMEKLGRENVCSLVKGEIETPNEISGVVYVPFDEN